MPIFKIHAFWTTLVALALLPLLTGSSRAEEELFEIDLGDGWYTYEEPTEDFAREYRQGAVTWVYDGMAEFHRGRNDGTTGFAVNTADVPTDMDIESMLARTVRVDAAAIPRDEAEEIPAGEDRRRLLLCLFYLLLYLLALPWAGDMIAAFGRHTLHTAGSPSR